MTSSKRGHVILKNAYIEPWTWKAIVASIAYGLMGIRDALLEVAQAIREDKP